MKKTFTRSILSLLLLGLLVLPPRSFAVNSPQTPGDGGGLFDKADSIFANKKTDDDEAGPPPIVWDFLVLGSLNMNSNFYGGSLGLDPSGNIVYAGAAKTSSTGYGLSLGPEVWVTPNIGFRFLLQSSLYLSDATTQTTTTGLKINLTNKPMFAYGVVTAGPVIKLWGYDNYFVYLPIDVGYGLTLSSAGNPDVVGSTSAFSSTTGSSAYVDFGLGLNVRFLTIEAKMAWLPNPNDLGYGSSNLFYPLTIGFDF